ncbi:hypothetical protein TI39_contig338g00025 [Zymoseptoria brevis]|uniref:Uncharacterized protein n=1 Tax=Zymoseptoria brevis TaxID=1047168 RepID=A0A0F4GSM6_9PEZI|nr:hypothetical protein TI39_contig338g00025 [Zymoseptoria brevis]
MPPSKKDNRPKRSASSELGNDDWATDYNSKGRAIRKCRTARKTDESPFEDSAIAISDSELDDMDDEDDGNDSDIITVAPSRKKKRTRSPSPELRLDSEDDTGMMSDSSMSDTMAAPTAPSKTGHTTFHLTINIPTDQQGPITLHLDPKQYLSCGMPSGITSDRLVQSNMARLNARSESKKSKYRGFLDLPAELRNECYGYIFVSTKVINFSTADNFSRSSAILRTCHQLHEEGRSILYSENHFHIERRARRYGSFWEKEWRELGFLPARKFLKSIGQTNSALLRNVTFMLEDATPSLSPATHTPEERRFVHDDDLMSVLRHLADHCNLQTLRLHFHGRRKVENTDDRFLEYLKLVRADEVEFVKWPPEPAWRPIESKQDQRVKLSLLECCTRKRKKFATK